MKADAARWPERHSANAHGDWRVSCSLQCSTDGAYISQDVLARQHAATLYIDPGCPWQNGFVESFNGTLRDECLMMRAFASVAEARVELERYRREYNEERPHSRLGYRTPAEFKADWLAGR